MQHLKPITWTPRPLRLIWHVSAVLVAALALSATGRRQARAGAVVVVFVGPFNSCPTRCRRDGCARWKRSLGWRSATADHH